MGLWLGFGLGPVPDLILNFFHGKGFSLACFDASLCGIQYCNNAEKSSVIF